MTIETLKKLMTESKMTYQIEKHHAFDKFYNIHHVIVARKYGLGAMTIDEFVDRCVDEHDEYISDIKSAVATAVRSGGKVFNQIILFSDDALMLLKQLANLATSLKDDNFFIISFAEQQSTTTGLKQFVQPVISVIDVSEEEPINFIAFENLKFVVKNAGYNYYYSAYDILDMKSVGNQVTLKKPFNYRTLSEIRDECLDRIYDYICLEYWLHIPIDPKFDAKDIEAIILEANQKMSEKEIFTCKVCGNHYTISEDERKWYAERNFKLPKRCSSCRHEARQKKIDEERAKDCEAMYRELGFGVPSLSTQCGE